MLEYINKNKYKCFIMKGVNVNKAELVEKIAKSADLSKAAAKELWMPLLQLLRVHSKREVQ